jgi:carnosine synthase
MHFVKHYLPHFHHLAESQRQLISAAEYCCRELGLHTGVYNVEMMMTSRGPRLIEVNGRMGGFYLRDWIRFVFGVDLMLCALMCACNVKPTATGPTSMYDSPHEVGRS